MRARAAIAALVLALAMPVASARGQQAPAQHEPDQQGPAQQGPAQQGPAQQERAPAAAPAPPAATTVSAPAADAARAGRYYLQGVMETGSELLLTGQGTFDWYFSYGALDLAARGRWRYEGADVVLEVEQFLAPDGHEAMEFARLELRAEGADLVPAWPWDGGAERGRYTRE